VVERLAQILGLFGAARRGLRVADVAARAGMRRSTAHRYVTALAQVGMLQRDGGDGSYTLGPLLIQLGGAALRSVGVVDRAGPFMQRLAAEAHQTTLLTLWGGQGPVIVRVQEDAASLMRITAPVGRTLSLDSAQALVFLAYLPDRAQVARLLAQHPDDERRELEREVRRAQAQGVAVSSRAVDGLRAIAAPVFDERGTIIATLGFVGTVSGLPAHASSGLAYALKDTARELSVALGYAPAAASSS
jgi:DNA-binding IclR family transcriptional regulator